MTSFLHRHSQFKTQHMGGNQPKPMVSLQHLLEGASSESEYHLSLTRG
jgi:hypothetical protein